MTRNLLDQDGPPRPDNASPAPGRPNPLTARQVTNARILRLPQVCNVTGYGRSMIYQMEAEHRFPKRIKLGERAVGWLESEVQEWLQQRIDCSRAGNDRAPR